MHRVCGMYVEGLVVRCLHAGRSVYAACTSSLTVLEKSEYAQGLWYVRRGVGCAFVRCLHAGRSVVYAACTSSLTVLRSAQCHTQQTTRIVRVSVFVATTCKRYQTTRVQHAAQSRRQRRRCSAAQPRTSMTPTSRQFRFPVCLLSTDTK